MKRGTGGSIHRQRRLRFRYPMVTTGERLHLEVRREEMGTSQVKDPSRRGKAKMEAKAIGEIEVHVTSVAT